MDTAATRCYPGYPVLQQLGISAMVPEYHCTTRVHNITFSIGGKTGCECAVFALYPGASENETHR
eukprot:756409-Rhodomonas_salina.1